MPDIFTETLRDFRVAEHAFAGHLPHHDQPGEHPYPDASAETPATPATTETTAQEEDMSKLGDELREHAARIDKFDDDVLSDVEKIQANPKTARAFARLRTLKDIDDDPIFDAAVGLLEAVPQTAPAELAAGQPA